MRREKRKKDGTYPLALRIIKERKPKYIHLGLSIEENHWDETTSKVNKSQPNSVRLNNLILKKLAEANDTTIELDTKEEFVSSEEIKNKIKRKGKNVTFFQLAGKRIDRYERKGTFSVSNAERSILNNFRKFLNGSDIYFHEINSPLIEKFKVFCKGELGHKPRTITNHLIIIRTLFNFAIKEGIVDRKYYPFAGDNVKIRIGSGLKNGIDPGGDPKDRTP